MLEYSDNLQNQSQNLHTLMFGYIHNVLKNVDDKSFHNYQKKKLFPNYPKIFQNFRNYKLFTFTVVIFSEYSCSRNS